MRDGVLALPSLSIQRIDQNFLRRKSALAQKACLPFCAIRHAPVRREYPAYFCCRAASNVSGRRKRLRALECREVAPNDKACQLWKIYKGVSRAGECDCSAHPELYTLQCGARLRKRARDCDVTAAKHDAFQQGAIVGNNVFNGLNRRRQYDFL